VKQKGKGTVSTSSTRAKPVLGKGGKEVPQKTPLHGKHQKRRAIQREAKNFLGPGDPVLAVVCCVLMMMQMWVERET
jgi:hypothetical protein